MIGFRVCATAFIGLAVLLLGSCSASSSTPATSGVGARSSASPTSPPGTATPAPGPAVFTPILGSVVAEPIPVSATDGKEHLAYELKLTNALGQDVSLSSLAVVSGDRTLLSLSGDELAYWTRVMGNPAPTTTLGPGQSALVWLDVALERPAGGGPPGIPSTVSHAIGLVATKPSPPLVPPTMTETIATVPVANRKPIEISPPLSGANWLDGDSCCDMGPHRMAVNPIDGDLYAAERFAIDYVQMTSDGKLFNGDKTRLESYPYYSAPIHAVGNGPVVAVVDGLPEQVPGAHPSGLPLDQYGGNHIVQDLGGGNYAFYAHLKTNSIRVRPGDQLTAGQTIAALGNTGNTDAPHLHFHVMSTSDPLRSNGLPFVLKSFKLDSRLASMAALDPLMNGQPAQLQPGFSSRDETAVSPVMLDVMTYSAG
jgi:Peptidase family M23